MKIGRVFLSGCAVYFIVAACSAIDPGRPESEAVGVSASGGGRGNAGSAGGAGPDGSGGRSGASAGGGVMDPVPTANADPASGTRLKAKFVVGSDGSKSYLDGQWYDSGLMIDCVATPAADGSTRCMPQAAAYAGSLYSDPECTDLVAYSYYPCTEPRPSPSLVMLYSEVYEPLCAPARYRVRRTGSAMPGPVYSRRSSGACAGAELPVGYSFYELGAEVPLSDFVELTLAVEP